MRTVGSFSELSDNLGFSRKQRSCGPSKADKLLGSGTGDTIPLLQKKNISHIFLLSTKLNEQEPWIQFLYAVVQNSFHCSLHSDIYIYLLSLLTCNFSTAAADILLWRDEKRTFSFVTVLFLLFYWFLLSDRTFVSSAAKFLLVTSLALFIHGVLPSQVYVFWLFSYLLSRLI